VTLEELKQQSDKLYEWVKRFDRMTYEQYKIIEEMLDDYGLTRQLGSMDVGTPAYAEVDAFVSMVDSYFQKAVVNEKEKKVISWEGMNGLIFEKIQEKEKEIAEKYVRNDNNK